MAPPVPREELMSTGDELFGRCWLATERSRIGNRKTNSEAGFSLLTLPRRLMHPVRGRSPDSRFNGLAAFPTS